MFQDIGNTIRSRYGQTAIVLLVAYIVGKFLWGWGVVAAAYGLLVYLIMAVGIRMDDLARDIRSIRDMHAADAQRQERMIHHLAQINASLNRLGDDRSPTSPSLSVEDPITPKAVSRD